MHLQCLSVGTVVLEGRRPLAPHSTAPTAAAAQHPTARRVPSGISSRNLCCQIVSQLGVAGQTRARRQHLRQ